MPINTPIIIPRPGYEAMPINTPIIIPRPGYEAMPINTPIIIPRSGYQAMPIDTPIIVPRPGYEAMPINTPIIIPRPGYQAIYAYIFFRVSSLTFPFLLEVFTNPTCQFFIHENWGQANSLPAGTWKVALGRLYHDMACYCSNMHIVYAQFRYRTNAQAMYVLCKQFIYIPSAQYGYCGNMQYIIIIICSDLQPDGWISTMCRLRLEGIFYSWSHWLKRARSVQLLTKIIISQSPYQLSYGCCHPSTSSVASLSCSCCFSFSDVIIVAKLLKNLFASAKRTELSLAN